MAVNTAIPTPPRIEGVADLEKLLTDVLAMHQWITDYHRSQIIESRLGDPSFQATADTIIPTALPDPAKTSIANGQAVANAAFRKAFGLPP